MHPEELAGILKRGGTVTIDCGSWRVDSAHGTIDMPASLADPLPGEGEGEHIDRQLVWWESLRVCDATTTDSTLLIEALCLLAGVRIQKP